MRDPALDERERFEDLFRQQRAAELAAAPAFAATMAAGQLARRRRVARRWVWAYSTVAVAATLVVGGFWLRGAGTPTPALQWSDPLGVRLTSVSWNAPTDFLLDTPDAAAISGVPQLTQVRDLMPDRTNTARGDTSD